MKVMDPRERRREGNRGSTVNVIIILFYALIIAACLLVKLFFIFLLNQLFRMWERVRKRGGGL